MCGPFVIAQVKCVDGNDTILKKLSGTSLLPYHFGRMTTYILLGIAAAYLSRQIIGTPLQKSISFVFLSVAGVIFIASALPQAKLIFGRFNLKIFSRFGELLGRVSTPLFSEQTAINRYALGLLLGLLPCGLIFASLMAVATTGNIFTAILGMSLFTIGTFPAMFLVGLGGHMVYKKWPIGMRTVARGIMIFNGLSLFALAGNIVL